MNQQPDVVITGMGVVSPIGIGCEPFWRSLDEGCSGIRSIPWFAHSDLPFRFGGYIADFDAKQYVKPRKSLKVMCREIQTAYAASSMAAEQAGLIDATGPKAGVVDPNRLGIVYGSEMLYGDNEELIPAYRQCLEAGDKTCTAWGEVAMRDVFPLWMLKFLPNMPACHVAIPLDARGPNNTLCMAETSSLAAVSEAVEVIRRGWADVMFAGGTGTQINAGRLGFSGADHLAAMEGDPTKVARPFDRRRRGVVIGEGAATLVLERREFAEARGATILGRFVSYADSHEPVVRLRTPTSGEAIRRSIRAAMAKAGLSTRDVGHVNAHGIGTPGDDPAEAAAIRDTLGDVPVTALKSYFGHLGAGSGAVELVGAVLSLMNGRIPRTLNCEEPDPDCPIRVVTGESAKCDAPFAVKLSQSTGGHAAALILARS